MEEETNKLTTEEIDKMLDLTSDEESDANPNPNEYLSNQGTSAGVSINDSTECIDNHDKKATDDDISNDKAEPNTQESTVGEPSIKVPWTSNKNPATDHLNNITNICHQNSTQGLYGHFTPEVGDKAEPNTQESTIGQASMKAPCTINENTATDDLNNITNNTQGFNEHFTPETANNLVEENSPIPIIVDTNPSILKIFENLKTPPNELFIENLETILDSQFLKHNRQQKIKIKGKIIVDMINATTQERFDEIKSEIDSNHFNPGFFDVLCHQIHENLVKPHLIPSFFKTPKKQPVTPDEIDNFVGMVEDEIDKHFVGISRQQKIRIKGTLFGELMDSSSLEQFKVVRNQIDASLFDSGFFDSLCKHIYENIVKPKAFGRTNSTTGNKSSSCENEYNTNEGIQDKVNEEDMIYSSQENIWPKNDDISHADTVMNSSVENAVPDNNTTNTAEVSVSMNETNNSIESQPDMKFDPIVNLEGQLSPVFYSQKMMVKY